jgi:hypothetical protein
VEVFAFYDDSDIDDPDEEIPPPCQEPAPSERSDEGEGPGEGRRRTEGGLGRANRLDNICFFRYLCRTENHLRPGAMPDSLGAWKMKGLLFREIVAIVLVAFLLSLFGERLALVNIIILLVVGCLDLALFSRGNRLASLTVWSTTIAVCAGCLYKFSGSAAVAGLVCVMSSVAVRRFVRAESVRSVAVYTPLVAMACAIGLMKVSWMITAAGAVLILVMLAISHARPAWFERAEPVRAS